MDKEFHTVRGYENINSIKNLLTPSMEDYLEMIYRCSVDNKFVRLNKIAQMLNVRDSSASKMMKKLGELSFINYEKYGIIQLTNKGLEAGKYLLDRHNTIENFLINLGASNELLTETELIEHVISNKTVHRIYMLNMFFQENKDILNKCQHFIETNNNE